MTDTTSPVVTQLAALTVEARRIADALTAPLPGEDGPHSCPPGHLYYCPTAGEWESSCHGGFDTCCDRPDLHRAASEAIPPGAATVDTANAPLSSPHADVQGRCPACGCTRLLLGEGGYVTCPRIDCPEPDAASTLLEGEDHAYRDAVNAPLRPETIAALKARFASGGLLPTRTLKPSARTTPDNPPASRDAATCGYVKPHLPHQYMRLEVLSECPGVPAASDDAPTELGTPSANANETTRHVGTSSVGEPATDAVLRRRFAEAFHRADPGPGYVGRFANVAMDVRDDEVVQLRADLKAMDRTRPTTWAYEQASKALEKHRQRADEAETTLAMQKGISADLRVESRARGEKLAAAKAAIARVQDVAEAQCPSGQNVEGEYEFGWAGAMAAVEAALNGPAKAQPTTTDITTEA